MKFYIVSSSETVLEHWNKALKKYHPIKLTTINELNKPNEGIVFLHDVVLSDEELRYFLNDTACAFMLLSMMPNFTKAQQWLSEGIMGYGNALMHESHLQSAYQAIEEGKVWLYPDFISSLISKLTLSAPKPLSEHDALTKLSIREREVALLLAQGMTHNEVAEKLNITVRTIKAHCSAIYEKLSVKDRLGLSLLLRS